MAPNGYKTVLAEETCDCDQMEGSLTYLLPLQCHPQELGSPRGLWAQTTFFMP